MDSYNSDKNRAGTIFVHNSWDYTLWYTEYLQRSALPSIMSVKYIIADIFRYLEMTFRLLVSN